MVGNKEQTNFEIGSSYSVQSKVHMAQIPSINMKWFHRIQNYLRLRLPLKWWFSALTACLGAFSGLLGSVYGEQIKSAFPFILGGESIIWSAVLFWISLLIFGCFFGLGFNAQNEATNKLEQVIRTLPPKNFLVVFEDLFKQSVSVYCRANEEQKKDNQHAAIKLAMAGVLYLVKNFDTRHDHPQYSANIMLFKQVSEVQQNDLKNNGMFIEPAYDSTSWDGVLQLQSEFAFTLEETGLKTDNAVKPILLPIPKKEFRLDKGKPTVLPGAPAVFCDPTTFVGFENTIELATWCRDQSGLRPSVADDVESYFTDGPGKEIRSFISIPILSPTDLFESKPKVIGVLNLHSNREGILPGEKAELFVPLTVPFMFLIAHSLEKYSLL